MSRLDAGVGLVVGPDDAQGGIAARRGRSVAGRVVIGLSGGGPA